ncbi:hypothetical protein [Sulfurimonas sp. C5]|uniref:hypothetical protein n=1 Tax=Sulfurimonas sp. C5 TaxID=3036947 RepID=UPI002454129F|nr:hypothetical protein [Sulfurimonas sp. C5]MDH4945342.1 hypothetical protein [Sulfurimonas sp. C5]
MIKCHLKYENLEDELTELEPVLKNSLQNEILTIKQLNKGSEKYNYVNDNVKNIENAEYVIYSTFMNENYHESEQFIFLDKTGKLVCTISGREMDLYDMIKDCENLVESKF